MPLSSNAIKKYQRADSLKCHHNGSALSIDIVMFHFIRGNHKFIRIRSKIFVIGVTASMDSGASEQNSNAINNERERMNEKESSYWSK